MYTFYNSGLQVALAKRIVVVEATLPWTCLIRHFPVFLELLVHDSTSCSLRVFFVFFFLKSGIRNGGGRQRNLCVVYIFSAIEPCIFTKAAMAKGGHRNSIHNLHSSRPEPP